MALDPVVVLGFGALAYLLLKDSIGAPPPPPGSPGNPIGLPGQPIPPDVSQPTDPYVAPWWTGIPAGASLGATLPGVLGGPWGMAIGAAIGGIITLVKSRTNETAGQREDFAQAIGFVNLGQLYDYLRTLGPEGERLWNIGINVIGRHDVTANEAWMRQVAELLQSTGYVIGVTPTTSSAVAACPAGYARDFWGYCRKVG